jgi:uncharacterized protein involved in response to NO
VKADAILWAGLAISPIVWFLNLQINFALAPLACETHAKWMLYLTSTAALIFVLLAGVLSWTQLRPLYRRRGMAIGGIALSALFFVVILAQTIPNLMLAGCE